MFSPIFLKSENKIINGLWVGDELSPLELLTIESFMHHGHEFHLWLYENLKTKLPEGVILHDATEIIPRDKIFCYEFENEWGHGKGSYAGFSDIFRYKLLHEKGGWWVDMDVTCLKAFDFEEPYFFRSHDILDMVGNVMKCPKGSPLMLDCYLEASKKINSTNVAWLKPIEILNNQIKTHDLSNYIIYSKSNLDRWEVIERLLRFNTIKKEWYFIHWLNEEWRSRGVSKNKCITHSALAFVHKKYNQSSNMEYLEIPYILLLLQVFWRDTILLWVNKFLNWLKKPGIPVFIKKRMKTLNKK